MKEKFFRGLWLFIIGFFAGVLPFLVIYYLPKILIQQNPNMQFQENALLYIPVFGVIVGIVCVFWNINEHEKLNSRQIFNNALTIPVILIAMVTNLMEQYNYKDTTDKLKESHSETIIKEKSLPLEMPATIKIEKEIVPQLCKIIAPFIQSLYAQPADRDYVFTPGKDDYLLMLESFTEKAKAEERYKFYQDYSFSTTQYYQKNIRLLKGADKNYYITYAGLPNYSEAIKAKRLLEINDLELIKLYNLKPKIFKVK